MTITGKVIFSVDTMKDPGSGALNEGGGPPVIADFDNDGRPEIGIAGGSRFRVFDLKCQNGGAGCEGPYIRWSKPSQDASSRQTGASVFDFDGDGEAEAVYADECFLRIYRGKTGDVLFSTPRTSGTWYENPVVADVDRDDHVEIVVNSAYSVPCPSNGTPGTPYVDPIHPGVRCMKNEDCVLNTQCKNNFCRCTGDNQCDKGLTCQNPLDGSGGIGKVCRSTHPNPDPKTSQVKGGVKVVNDRLDRWASSLPIWNQHAYSINNVRPNGSIPKMSEWQRNWIDKRKGYNSFRQNAQGLAGVDDLADVTGKLDPASICRVRGNVVVLSARVCNRGRRAVGSKLPATFYDNAGKILCVSYTAQPVQGNNDCQLVTCEADRARVMGSIKIVVNDDGMGGRTTVECRDENNSDVVTIKPSDCIIE
jgi:FG-GAP-like repeat